MKNTKINARHLIIDLFLSSAYPQLTIKQILVAAKLFNLSENGIRVATTRLLNEGMIESVERGIYQLSPPTKDWAKVILNRKNGIKQTKEWQQHYLAVFTGTLGRIDRTALKKRERVLRQFGFKELETGIYIRPDNLAYSFEKTCEELVLAGLEKEAKICIIQHFEPSTLKQIFSLWDTKQLEKNYEMYSRDITHWLENYTHLSLNDAAVKALLLGRETIALLMNDPLLPAPFVSESARNQFAQDVQQLDAIGQKLWKKIYEQELNL
ncbi:PaaX family transcriptional regulator C-terminal domain-containing protein [Acinetobacter seifertii]|uniref:PaaX family transcriptional regulator C-terminal domain-containing protein n=1 Tax=Acinetobacter seifertii TaxID=1530123 RepID=UPI001904CB1C|nr:PaaX family transcriptional regulator C-terminal domain-containing protein [Acinetobacter seifertii]MBJ9423428.1 PaaX family transcriptional regulator [Acinetobacter seifertii]